MKELGIHDRYLLPLVCLLLSICLLSAMPAMAAKDFVLAVDDDTKIYMAESNGDGTFSGYAKIGTLSEINTRGVTINDFNNDGHMDFIMGRADGDNGNLFLFLNDGTNRFENAGLVGTVSDANDHIMDLASGDFNNDGYIDFVGHGNSAIVGVFLNDGYGGFTKTEYDLEGSARGMDTADFDNDGNLDIVRARYSSGYVDVYWGDGTGAFGGSSTNLGTLWYDPYGVAAGDFDEDGNVDVFVNYGSSGDSYFVKGNGTRTFHAPVYEASLDFNNHGAYDAYDYNGDNHLDIVATNYSGRRVLYYPGNGDATFGTGIELGSTEDNSLGVSAFPSPPPAGIPVSSISPVSAVIAEGGIVDFDGSASSDDGSIPVWAWAFGDGGTDTVADPAAHTYTDEGFYAAVLKVTDNEGNIGSSASQVFVQGDAPVIDTDPLIHGESHALFDIWFSEIDAADFVTDTENNVVHYEWALGSAAEDFETGTAGDPAAGWTVYAGTWTIDDTAPISGALSFKQSNASLGRTHVLMDTPVYQGDLVIEADIYLESGSGEEAQILFRGQDNYNNYEMIIRGRGYNDVLLYRRINNSASNRYEYDLPSADWGPKFPIDAGQEYHAKIICQGPWISFYLEGHFLFTAYDDTFSGGKVGFSTYSTAALFDNLTVTETASGQVIRYPREGRSDFSGQLTATDAGGQQTTAQVTVLRQPGAAPVAEANGPYSVSEADAVGGGWNVSLDSAGSSDDVEVGHCVWNFGLDTFSGTDFNENKWYTNGDISQDGVVSQVGVNAWDNRYMVSKSVFPNTTGQIFQAKIMIPGSGQCMFGFKNENNSNFHYNQFPYEFYIYNANINIYENSNGRGDTGYDISYNTWYDFKIEIAAENVIYSFRPSGTTDWTTVYTSEYTTTDTLLRKGMVVYSGTCNMDDFVETTAGDDPVFTLYQPGGATYPVELTVYDRVLQSATDTAQVTLVNGAFPNANAGPDQVLDETGSSGGAWTVSFDAGASSDTNGIYLYEWDFDYDESTFNPSGVTGSAVSYSYGAPGIYTVAVRVTDHALQSSISTMTVTISQGNPPAADAGGPYSVNEETGSAHEGAWTVTMDGSASSDAETSIDKYEWDFGTETFEGQTVISDKWYFSDGVVQDDAIRITGTGGWGTRYLCSKAVFTRQEGLSFEATVNLVSGDRVMVGFKNSNSTSFSYTQMPYAIYFYYGNLRIYENGSYRVDTGYDYSTDTQYDIRIELKAVQGARYYYRVSGTTEWTLIYDSDYSAETQFRKNIDVYSGSVFEIDDLKETAGGVSPTHVFTGFGSHTIFLTVWDQSGQTDTDTSSVTTLANDPPVAEAGPDQSQDETDAFEGTWTVDFDGSGSTDDFGIFQYEWDFDDDGVYDASGAAASHVFNSPGTHVVTLRVTDHGLQSTIDTMNVVLSTGAPPVAIAGSDITTEGHWPVFFNGGGSSDEVGIERYEWHFGDYVNYVADTGPISMGEGKTPRHIYWENGDYPVTLTVYDKAAQSDTDTLTVHVITGDAPVAIAGGPYYAGAGGPPAYLNGGQSTDDYGIVKYLWDVDTATDSDGDGTADNDQDVVGRKPIYTYASTGTYEVKLTVVDGAGQTSTDTASVVVSDNLAPDVICVPWRASDPTIPHETYNGRSIRLKAIVRDAGDLTYQWSFGDGTVYPASPEAVTSKYAVEASHTYPDSVEGTPYVATLRVWDSAGLEGSDQYYIVVKADNYDTRTNIAIDEGLWYTHKTQNRTAGANFGLWSSYSTTAYFGSSTASAIQAFEINGHLMEGDHQEDPYVETVINGFGYLFTYMLATSISAEPAGDPDSNGNGIGVETAGSREIYEGGMVMDAIASSNNPLAFATTGGSNINGRFFFHILTDMMDMYAWGQDDSGTNDRGGWRYTWDSDADNSACQWAAIGMLAAEDTFGINVPQFVKTENNDYWLQDSYNGIGFGYTSADNGVATTPSGMVQLAFCDQYTTDPRWKTAEDYIANNWFWQDNNYYAVYALVKAFRLARPYPVETLQATGLDWYGDPSTGVRKRIVDKQVTSGGDWGSWLSGGYGGRGLNTSWAIIMLTPTLFVQPPVADAGDDIIWAYDLELTFSAAGSFHLDPTKTLVKYEWDFDGDGIWDFTTTDPNDPNAKWTYRDPNPNIQGDEPEVFDVRLRVTDNNQPAQTDVDIRQVTVAEPPHAPYAVHGGPYTATAGIPFTLDASNSYDIDMGDYITRFEWDLDNDGVWFDDVDLDTEQKRIAYTYTDPGVYLIGLRVTDAGMFNPVGCIGDQCELLVSKQVFSQVVVEANLPPAADAGGPYVVDEGAPITLDGTGSSDPNGDALTYAWDLDNDGNYDDSTSDAPSFTWNDDGEYTVGLKVSDSLLENTVQVTVLVNDLGPTADFTFAPAPQEEGSAVSFTDASTSSPDPIATWEWDFGGQGTSTEQNPSFAFQADGIYTVSLTVTDDDGSQSFVSKDVEISDKAPVAALSGNMVLSEGETGTYDASGSTSSPDTIQSYEWDWDYDGSTFVPSADSGDMASHTWMVNGTYTVALRVTDSDASTDIATLTVTVNDLGPVAAVSGDTSLNEGQAGHYSAAGSTSSPDAIQSYEWDWSYNGSAFAPSGDSGVSASHTWTANGTYTVAVRVTDTDGSKDIATVTVMVHDLGPTAALSGDAVLNEGDTGNYDASGSTPNFDLIVDYEWDWNYDGSAFTPSGDTGATVSHLWTVPGTHTVAVRVSDIDGSEDIATLTVTVNALGRIIVIKQTDPDGASETFGFTGELTGTLSDDGQISKQVPAGTYTVTETVAQDWELVSIVFDDADSTGDLGTATATFRVDAGETVQCTFTNRQMIFDQDQDGVPDDQDNCPTTPNPDQEDLDGDGIGDACDGTCPVNFIPGDLDGDCDVDGKDLASYAAYFNEDFLKTFAANFGFPSDHGIIPDQDMDGVADALDNCPATPNPDQADLDGDGIGDACDGTCPVNFIPGDLDGDCDVDGKDILTFTGSFSQGFLAEFASGFGR